MNMNTITFRPSEVTQIETLINFYELVSVGGQISLAPAILMKQICSAQRLGICSNHTGLIACAAIKSPQDSYLRKVFENAGIEKIRNKFEYELGYCVTVPKESGKGLMTQLVSHLMIDKNNTNLFATTQSPAMAKILIKNGFIKNGKTHITEDGRKIDLYTYEF